MSDITFTDWRKSRFSFSNGACVEVGAAPGAVGVRDTEDREGPALLFAASAWRKFTSAVRAGTIEP